jgi:hypothetical protein
LLRKTAILAGAAFLVVSPRLAAQVAAPPLPPPNHIAHAVRIDPAEAPVIDGDLSDPVWAKAEPLEDFRQVEPDTGAPATERTVVRILYDENNLYFSVYCYDKEPDKIIVRGMTRDGPVFAEDEFRIALDPNYTRRDGYEFEVGAAGAHEDGLIQYNTGDLTRWNTIWQMRTRIVADGWVAEIAIPFRDLSYDPSRTDWGFDFLRQIRRKAERVRWATQNPAIATDDISQEGVLAGIERTNVGIGLDVKAYGRIAFKQDWKPVEHGAFSGAAGVVANYKLAQALTLTGTLNPDFSDSPLDDRQVNTTRFSLFIPESRDFFLQDAPSYEFGGLAFIAPFDNAPNGQPFFSRNVGLIHGTPVTIFGGGKLSGEYDDIGIGGLFAHTNSKANTPAQDLSVLRMTEPVLGESKVGFIVTNGDPTGLTRNTLAGADFQYLDSHFIGEDIFQGSLYYERSFSSALGQDDAFGSVLNFPNEPWAGELIYRQVGQNFAPALGYLNRPGIRDYEAMVSEKTRYRDPFVRWLLFGAQGLLITGLDDRIQSSQLRLWAEVESQRADAYDFNVYNYHENVPATFCLATGDPSALCSPRGVPVLGGNYDWTNIAPHIVTTRARFWAIDWLLQRALFEIGCDHHAAPKPVFRVHSALCRDVHRPAHRIRRDPHPADRGWHQFHA